ncbi:MAG TPA: LCP family protein [Marmoricola sp.]|nr:LCP family protein [Marmoricola sp.]
MYHDSGARRPSPAVFWTVMTLLVALLLVLVGAIALSLTLQTRLGDNLGHFGGAFKGLSQRPARPTSGPAKQAVNILVLGTDRRSRVPTTGKHARASDWVYGAQRSDTIMVLHIDGDRRGASVISIPRDSWVDIPGYGHAKINAAFSWAGPSLAVRTVEALTGVRIDHVAVVDWAGFGALTNALGGVEVDVPNTVRDPSEHVTWTAGWHRLDGSRALDYVRMREGLPGGDFDRIHRQQYFLHQVLRTTLRGSLWAHPLRTFHLVDVLTRHMSVDAGWSRQAMVSLLLSLRGIESSQVHYLTVPVRGTGWAGDQSVVWLDRAADRSLWRAVRSDRVERWLRYHPAYALKSQVS